MEERPSAAFHSSWLGLLVLVAGLLIGATVLKVERVVRAEGQVRAADPIAQIVAPTSGRIQGVHVREGVFVRKGERLLTLEPDTNGLNIARARLQLVRHAASYAVYSKTPLSVLPYGSEEAEIQRTARASAEADLRSMGAQLHTADQELLDTAAELEVEATVLGRLRALEVIVQERHERHERLVRDGFQSPDSLFSLDRERVDLLEQGRVARARLEKARTSIERRQAVVNAIRADLAREHADRIAAAHGNLLESRHEVDRLTDLSRNTVIESPTDGVVEQMSDQLAGNAVRGGDRLLAVVPLSSKLEIHLRIKNEDFPHVQIGQAAEFRFDAFPHSIYGFHKGRVQRLSHDILVDRKESAEYGVVAEIDPASPDDHISLKVRQGMRVSANISVGMRRPIEIWLEPFMRFATESLRDR